MASPEPEPVGVPIVWVGVEDVAVLATNQAIIQHSGRDEFILTFGQLAPPVILGTDEERMEQVRMTTFVSVKPVARLGLNRQRLKELITALQGNLEIHDVTFDVEDTDD